MHFGSKSFKATSPLVKYTAGLIYSGSSSSVAVHSSFFLTLLYSAFAAHCFTVLSMDLLYFVCSL